MDPSTAKALAELQKRPEGGESLFEHLSNLVANVLDSADDSLDLATLSKLLKKQTVQEPVTDAILPYRPVQDGSSAKQALALFGCGATPAACVACMRSAPPGGSCPWKHQGRLRRARALLNGNAAPAARASAALQGPCAADRP